MIDFKTAEPTEESIYTPHPEGTFEFLITEADFRPEDKDRHGAYKLPFVKLTASSERASATFLLQVDENHRMYATHRNLLINLVRATCKPNEFPANETEIAKLVGKKFIGEIKHQLGTNVKLGADGKPTRPPIFVNLGNIEPVKKVTASKPKVAPVAQPIEEEEEDNIPW